jgi:hypothetical protein
MHPFGGKEWRKNAAIELTPEKESLAHRITTF